MPMACHEFAFWMGDGKREERKKEIKAISSMYGRYKNGIHNKHDNPIKLKIVYFFLNSFVRKGNVKKVLPSKTILFSLLKEYLKSDIQRSHSFVIESYLF
jgi:hypothetical protein